MRGLPPATSPRPPLSQHHGRSNTNDLAKCGQCSGKKVCPVLKNQFVMPNVIAQPNYMKPTISSNNKRVNKAKKYAARG